MTRFLAILFLTSFFFLPLRVLAQTEPNVLLLNSYHKGLVWSDDIVRGVEDTLLNDAELIVEYMDTKRYLGEDYFDLLEKLYEYKYDPDSIELVLASDDNAYRFMLKYHDILFPGVPVVFCGVNHFKAGDLEGKKLFTGVRERVNQRKTIELALSLHPDTEKVVVVTDSTTSGRGHRLSAEKAASKLPGVEFVYLDEQARLTAQGLLDRISKLGPNTVVYYADFFRDAGGKFVDLEKYFAKFSAASPAPIYVHASMYVPLGAVGGYVVSPYYQGMAAARMVNRVLRGESVENVPVMHESPNQYLFNYEHLKRFGVDLSRLPENSEVLGRPESLYARYKMVIWTVAFVIILLASIIISLIVTIIHRRRAENALKVSHETLTKVLDSVEADIYASDLDTCEILFMNRHMQETFGEGLVGRHCHYVLRGEDERCSICMADKLLDENGEPSEPIVWEDRNPVTGKWCLNYDTAIQWIDGRLVKLQVSMDITERKEMEQQLENAKEMAVTANKSKDEFLANISHEIRTPLNGIFGMLQLLGQTRLASEQRKYIDTALASGENLLRIINDILDISKMEAGRVELSEEAFDLREAVSSVVNSFALESRAKGIPLNIEIEDATPQTIIGDKGRLRQILFNLLGNSLKFTDQGEVRLGIVVLPSVDEDRHRLLFEVSDTGIGIPSDKLDTVFDAFSQVDGSYQRRYQGVGLGLGIVKRLIRLMQGELCLDSSPGIGTSMYFSIDFGSAAEEIKKKPAPGPVQEIEHGRVLHILVAEDDPTNIMTLQYYLEKKGYKVTKATNGREALDELEKNASDLDLVLMDIQMPYLSGMEATKKFRSMEAEKDGDRLPIIAITAHAMKGDQDQFLAEGLDDYVAKPVDFSKLDEIIGKYVKADSGSGS